jgi:hypothetical protein
MFIIMCTYVITNVIQTDQKCGKYG